MLEDFFRWLVCFTASSVLVQGFYFVYRFQHFLEIERCQHIQEKIAKKIDKQ